MKTLERAARAVADYIDETSHGGKSDEDFTIGLARTVLMAVLPTLDRLDTDDCPGVYRADDGEYVRYDDLTAILAEGE